jgi:hypothetical protein
MWPNIDAEQFAVIHNNSQSFSGYAKCSRRYSRPSIYSKAQEALSTGRYRISSNPESTSGITPKDAVGERGGPVVCAKHFA